jgi:antitoxin VapB
MFFTAGSGSMSINIKNKEAERLLAEIKARTGRGTTDLLLDLLRRERERLSSEQAREAERALEDMRWLQERWRTLPILDPRSPDEIIGYDENGLPV